MVKQILPKAGEAILALFNKLGGNMNNVLGSRSNITFLGKGKTPEGFIDSDINIDAIGVLGKDKILSELESSIGYLTAGKLNDVQANKLLSNMQKVDEVFNPPQISNITDMATGTRDLTQEGLGSLRSGKTVADDLAAAEGVETAETILPTRKLRTIEEIIANPRKMADEANFPGETYSATPEEQAGIIRSLKDIAKGDSDLIQKLDDLPPPGSRGGADDIAAPFQSADETIANLEKQEAGLGEKFKTLITNKADIPMKRATAREFLVLALRDTDDFAFGKTTLSDFMTATDRKYVIEGGGGIAGDPIVLVEKYFGPRIAEAIPERGLKNDEIIEFTRRVLNNVVDANGNKPDSPRFDRFTAQFVDEMAKGGLAKILEG